MSESLLWFDNGVYDLQSGQFMEGRRDSHSPSVGMEYPVFDGDEPLLAEVRDFMEKLFPNVGVREYVWTLLSRFLDGEKGEKCLYLWLGSGGNGKTKLLELLEMTLGGYSGRLPHSILESDRGMSEERGCGDNYRLGLLPDADRWVRMRGEVGPRRMVMCGHFLPELCEDRSERRLYVIEFKSRFVREEVWDGSDPYQFVGDGCLGERLFQWRPAFMWLLLQYRKKSLLEPIELIVAKERYREERLRGRENHFRRIVGSLRVEGWSLREIYNDYRVSSMKKAERVRRKSYLVEYLKSRGLLVKCKKV